MIKIYTAARFCCRPDIRIWAEELWLAGFMITSSWLNETIRPDHVTHDEFWKKMAVKDIAEITEADILILDTSVEAISGGRECEFGYALGRFQNKKLVVVGPIRNVFHTLADKHFDDWRTCVDWLKEEYKDYVKEVEKE